jgi:cytochrome c-type biogenesis protein CcmH/NrfG
MAGSRRWLGVLVVIMLLVGTGAVSAQEKAPPAGLVPPTTASDDLARLLEQGQQALATNNPDTAPPGIHPNLNSTPDERNAAGEQALSTFQTVVKRFPQSAEGWMWLGITLTSTLHYSKEHPNGEPAMTDANKADGLDAFRRAYERAPKDIACVAFYSDALIELKRDFDTARKVWDAFLPHAKDDIQRVTALTQCARACLNKAYYGKAKGMAATEVRRLYKSAQEYVDRAAKMTPKADCVVKMQQLLAQYEKYLNGK